MCPFRLNHGPRGDANPHGTGANHRSICVDTDIDKQLADKIKAPIGPPVRGLKLKNIIALTKYQDQLQQYTKQHRMREKIESITQGLHDADKIQDKNEREKRITVWVEALEKWDKLFIDLMLASEKKCSKTG